MGRFERKSQTFKGWFQTNYPKNGSQLVMKLGEIKADTFYDL